MGNVKERHGVYILFIRASKKSVEKVGLPQNPDVLVSKLKTCHCSFSQFPGEEKK